MAISARPPRPASSLSRRCRPESASSRPCSESRWSSAPGASSASRRSALRISDKAQRVLREGEELADLARAEGQPLTGELRMGVIPTIAPFLLPTMLPRLRDEWPKPQTLPARGDQPVRLRCAPPRPARLRAARHALRLRRGRNRGVVRRPVVRRLSEGRGAGRAPRSTRAPSTKAGCCCSKTAIA